MRCVTWLVAVTLSSLMCAGQSKPPDASQGTNSDPYSIAFVKSAFEAYRTSVKTGVLPGIVTKHYVLFSPSLPELGDRVSIAVLKLHGLDELVRPENTDVYLTLVVLSFSDRRRVTENSDQEPWVTLLLLNYLQQKNPSDSQTVKSIEYLKVCTREGNCSFDSERRFVMNH